MAAGADAWDGLNETVVACTRCPRLVAHRERVAQEKRRAFQEWTYWGRPLPGFGDRRARLLVVGLAPAAHGGNRTGRIFTGDRSGDWLFRALHKAGFANQATSTARDDGLRLRDCYITAAVRCAPPGNRPTRKEFGNCQPYLERELRLLSNLEVVVPLGRAAFDAVLRAWWAVGHAVPRPKPTFGHGVVHRLPPVHLVVSYHPSQRNTFTGTLTEPMFDAVFRKVLDLLHGPSSAGSSEGPEGAREAEGGEVGDRGAGPPERPKAAPRNRDGQVQRREAHSLPMPQFRYPDTPAVEQVDVLHGVEVRDPYRWLEDTDAPETRKWIEAQNRLTFSYLEGIPAREGIRRRLEELWNFPRRSAPVPKGGRYFQLRNSGLQNQDVLYVADDPTDVGRVLLDPNRLSEDGTVALTAWAPSKDGRWLAYATSAGGSDWKTWRIRDVATGEDLPDVLEWSKFSDATWRHDGSGFFYAAYDPPEEGEAYEGVNLEQKVYFHRLGDPQAEDDLVYARPDEPEWLFGPELSDDGRYLVLHVGRGTDTRNRLFVKDLEADEPVLELIPEADAQYTLLGNDGTVLYLQTDLDAPRGRIIAVDLDRPERRHWRTLVPEDEDTLEQALMVHDEFVALYLHDASHRLRRFDRAGQPLGDISLPGLGSIFLHPDGKGLNGFREDDELFFAFQSFAVPPTVYRFDFRRAESEQLFAPDLPFDFAPYRTRQVFVRSQDGTRVPMFLVHRRGLARDGRNPTLLYGYGGFRISVLPAFQVARLVWLEAGGVLAVANLRGGGEYGEAWHRAGMLHSKQNVFDDFIACAEWLVRNHYTARERLAIEGRSNGGLLVGACITQRPDLFGAAHAAVGVMDMIRFPKFTIGWAWTSDYGSPDDPKDFQTLLAYSPLHNVGPGTSYPATLLTTADHDDRVVPGHSFKFAAAMQAAQAGDAPVLIRIQTKAGHGYATPTSLLIEERADVWAFLGEALGVRWPYGRASRARRGRVGTEG